MVTFASGLIATPQLTQRNVSIDLNFEPSVGIMARRFDKLGIDIRSFRVPLQRAVKQVMIPSIRQNFDSGGRPAWAPLSDFTVKKKGNANILIDGGGLRHVMGQINIWTIDTEKAMITDLPQKVWYGKLHQAGYGGTQTSIIKNTGTGKSESFIEGVGGGAPARPFVMIQNEDANAIDMVFTDWLGERIAAAGLGGSRV